MGNYEMTTTQDDVIAQVASLSSRDVGWLKYSESGFFLGEVHYADELRGIIFDTKLYCIKFAPGDRPHRVPFVSVDDVPDGYEVRTDVFLKLDDGETVGISMSPSSTNSYSHFVRKLLEQRLSVNRVLTVLSTRMVANKKGQRFCLLDFKYILPEPGFFQVEDVEDAEVEDGVPF